MHCQYPELDSATEGLRSFHIDFQPSVIDDERESTIIDLPGRRDSSGYGKGLGGMILRNLNSRSPIAWYLSVWLMAWGVYSVRVMAAETDEEYFEAKVRPILVKRCESCHSAKSGKTHGGLALDSRQGWQKGGESGPAISPGQIDDSLFLTAIRYSSDEIKMPPEEAGGKLPDAEIAVLVEWVRRGAPDPRTPSAGRGGLTEQELANWWSFQPLKSVAVPSVDPSQVRNDVDRFLKVRLDAQGLTPSPEADRRTLIRRATYDLTGLPPTIQEVEAFVNDNRPTAYECLIERLLQSPHYGERWGRHWLDLVRYADTAGENTDHPIPDAWRYRNWVIDALNKDLPYDQFVREQLAGDLIHAGDPPEQYAAGVISTGFLAIARRFDHDSDKHMHLTFEDTIDTMGRAFLGLSVACARCHDHKYDPISAGDYYALYGILNSTRFSFPGCEAKQQPRDMVPLLPPGEWARVVEPFDQQVAAIESQMKQVAEAQQGLANELKASASNSTRPLAQGVISDGGSQTFESVAGPLLESIDVKAGQMILLTIDPQGNYGADTTVVEWEIAEQGGTQRTWNLTRDLVGDFLSGNPHADSLGNAGVWAFFDPRGGLNLLSEPIRELMGKPGLQVWRNGDNPAVFVNSTKESIAAWTTLPAQTVFVHPASDGAVAIGWVSPIEGKVRVTGRVADGHPTGPNGVGWSLELISADSGKTMKQLAEFSGQRAQLATKRSEMAAQAPRRDVGYSVAEGTIANARIQLRGDPEKLGDEVPRRWLERFGGQQIPEGAGSGRLQLAQWITDPANPLVARVMVNRIWQHHFGKGFVPTPNDFGTRGALPTHPELLDWLAGQFLESGWSIKAMHRLIMQSAAYRRGSVGLTQALQENALSIDPNNALYWRFDRRRLTAEELRDSLLVASRQIDLLPGEAHPIPAASTWSYSQHVPFAGVSETDKRSVYQMTLRNRRPPFMSLFDGADPNATTPQRQVTTVPTQSLYFMNDPFFHAQAEKVARRTLNQADTDKRLDQLFEIVFQRLPEATERDAAAAFLTRYAEAVADLPAADQPIAIWSALTRVLLSSSQFLYVD